MKDYNKLNYDDKNLIADLRLNCFESLLLFTEVFFKNRTNRDFELSQPIGRESHYLTIIKALEKVFRGETKRLIINVPPRHGKAISIDTPILTKEGWTIAGEIKIGDEIIGSNGWVKVEGVYHQGFLEAKEVFFNDGQSIICNDEHLWNVCDRYTPIWKTLNTSQIEKTLYESDGRKHWRIPLIDGEYEDGIVPFMSPYLFGCWLGDGHSHYAAITTMDKEIVDSFNNNGYTLRLHSHQSAGKAKTYGILGLSKILRKYGLLKNKHIPDECYLWSKADRLALLQGLMDTDGTCNKKHGQVSFTNVNSKIIYGVGYLVNSLGGTYRVYTRKSGTKTLNIRLPDNLQPFRLQRKQQYVGCGIKCSPKRFISNIIESEMTEMVCFTVDSDDKLYAIGDGLILTHNTELVIHFIAWTLAQCPDSNYLYVSCGQDLATTQTQVIKEIIERPLYKNIFGIELQQDSQAKDNFKTTDNGWIRAFGAGGMIVGRGAGIQNVNRWGGCIVIDDIHKPDEVTSDTKRERINNWFYNTLQSRVNSPTTPIIIIGHCLHEDDLLARLKQDPDWDKLIIPAIDGAGNVIHPRMHDRKTLLKLQEQSPYVFAAQYQQDPQPSGGGIFKREWFLTLEYEPDIIDTFITVDTAETDKDYNDATVFSFWGVYRIVQDYVDTGIHGIHWLDCWEIRIEPKDLQPEFFNFYRQCMTHKCKPRKVYIEKKSTGSTLLSALKIVPGMLPVDIPRTKSSGSKTDRFLAAQPYVSSRRVTLPTYSKHTKMCIDHMSKITANSTHRFDDVCYLRGSKIATLFGYKNIENIKVGEKVITPFGLGRVSACGPTGYRHVINNIGLTGTPNHPVYYDNEFLPLISVPDTIKLEKLLLRNLIKWKIKKSFILMKSNIDLHHRQDIINLAKKDIGMNSFIELFGNFIADKKYLKIMSSIIKIMIGLIITTAILSVFHLSNIVRFILKVKNLMSIGRKYLGKCGEILKNGTIAKKVKLNKEKLPLKILMPINWLNVVFAKKNLLALGTNHICAANNVKVYGQINGIEKDMRNNLCLNQYVSTAKINLQQNNQYQKNIAVKHVQGLAQDDMDMKEVFNLTVETDGVYYVNNILVSNCDTACDAIEIALIKQEIGMHYFNEPVNRHKAHVVTDKFRRLMKIKGGDTDGRPF